MIELSRKKGWLAIGILERPPGHPEHRGANAASRDVIGVAGIPRLRRCQPRLASWVGEDLRRVAELLDLLDDAPLEIVDVLWQPRISRQADVNPSRDAH